MEYLLNIVVLVHLVEHLIKLLLQSRIRDLGISNGNRSQTAVKENISLVFERVSYGIIIIRRSRDLIALIL